MGAVRRFGLPVAHGDPKSHAGRHTAPLSSRNRPVGSWCGPLSLSPQASSAPAAIRPRLADRSRWRRDRAFARRDPSTNPRIFSVSFGSTHRSFGPNHDSAASIHACLTHSSVHLAPVQPDGVAVRIGILDGPGGMATNLGWGTDFPADHGATRNDPAPLESTRHTGTSRETSFPSMRRQHVRFVFASQP